MLTRAWLFGIMLLALILVLSMHSAAQHGVS